MCGRRSVSVILWQLKFMKIRFVSPSAQVISIPLALAVVVAVTVFFILFTFLIKKYKWETCAWCHIRIVVSRRSRSMLVCVNEPKLPGAKCYVNNNHQRNSTSRSPSSPFVHSFKWRCVEKTLRFISLPAAYNHETGTHWGKLPSLAAQMQMW